MLVSDSGVKRQPQRRAMDLCNGKATPSTPYKLRSKPSIHRILSNDSGTSTCSGCKYEERDEQRGGVKTTEKQKIEPTTPEPSRPRLCLKRKRVATQTFHHLEQSASLRCKNAEMSKKKPGKKIQTAKLCVSASSACLASTENKAKIFDEHCKYAYHTRNLIRAAEGIFSELEESKNEKFPWRNGDHQSWTEKPKTTSHLVAMKEWRMLLEGVGSSSSSSLVMEEECCLERESEPLRNLVSVFIENVRGVQGDRCYSQWKGSVLDSVIGAFLAQNTSDQMSSSAFMSLAARFPLKPQYRLRERVENNEFSGVVDCLHWDAVRQAKVQDVSKAISPRGMHNRLAKRIKALLNWLVKEHHGLNLEELRHAAPEIIIKFLQKFTGIGVKSVECVRLLALTQKAFPVDTHVARVTIRLGWIPLPPVLYEHQTRVSDRYRRVIKLIHQYLWSLLQELDHETLYQLHCQMITFGKVFCTNNNPNCSVCPMRENCKYYKSRVERRNQAKTEKCKSCNVVAEACTSRCSVKDIEDYSTGRKKPVEKRMKHVVYELPDKHPLLASVRTRVVEDSSPYLLVVWEPAEIINHSMSEQSEASSEGKKLGSLCRQPVAGTIMIPCRTALGGSFPLNGTFFQINEMFADHKTSESPLKVPRGCLAMLPKKVLHCGTSITEIVRGLSGEDICRCFKEGYICTRGFDQETGFPKPLNDRFQLLRPAS